MNNYLNFNCDSNNKDFSSIICNNNDMVDDLPNSNLDGNSIIWDTLYDDDDDMAYVLIEHSRSPVTNYEFNYSDINYNLPKEKLLSCFEIEIIMSILYDINGFSRTYEFSLKSVSEYLFYAEYNAIKEFFADASGLLNEVFGVQRHELVVIIYEFLDSKNKKNYKDTYIYEILIESIKKDDDTIAFLHKRIADVFCV